MHPKSLVVLSSICLFISCLSGGSVLADTNWTDQSAPINYANWNDVTITDFNSDNIADIVAANPDAGEPYSMRSGLPVWIGTITGGKSYNWALSESYQATGWSPSLSYPDPSNQSGAVISRVYCGNPGNMMADWTIECISEADIYDVVVIHGSNTYTAEKTQGMSWYDFYHYRNDKWRFTYHAAENNFSVWSQNYGNQNARMTLDVPYVSDQEEIKITCHIESGTPMEGDSFEVYTQPAGFQAYAVFHGTGGEPSYLHPEANRSVFYMGEYVEDIFHAFGFEIDPGDVYSESVTVGEKWYFTSPGGPVTDSAYYEVKTADVNRDGQEDILACGPDGLSVFYQAGPAVSDVAFKGHPECRDDWFPGTMEVFLGSNPTVIRTEIWTVYYDGTCWQISGERSGSQPPMCPGEPWPGPYCGQFDLNIESGNYCSGDTFIFSTFRLTWTDDVGPATTHGYRSFDIGDINHDGRIDMVAARLTGGIDIYSFTGTSWVPLNAPAGATTIRKLKLEDMNNDGRLDIIAVSETDGIHVWKQLSGVQWSSDVGPVNTGGFSSMVIGDFNNDGMQDIAATSMTDAIFIWYQRTSGEWFQKVRASMPERAKDNVGDGSVSAVKVSNTATKTESWQLICVQTAPDGGVFEVRGDVSGTQTARAYVGQHYFSDGGEVEFTIYDGPTDFAINDKFTFITGTGPLSYIQYSDISAGDLDGNGSLDLSASSMDDSGIRVWLGNGVYGWTQQTPPEDSNTFLALWSESDINFDGIPDMVACSGDLGGIKVWIAQRDQQYPNINWIYKPIATGFFAKIATGDFNNDGKTDIVAANLEDQKDGIWVWEGDEHGEFYLHESPTHKSGYYAVTTADFNLDGKMDIAAGHPSDGFDVWLAEDDWEWSFSMSGISSGDFSDLVAGDINRDGYPDLIAAKNYASEEDSGVMVYLNDTTGAFPNSPGYKISFPTTLFNYWGVDVADFDHNGVLDIIASRRAGNPGVELFWGFEDEGSIIFPGSYGLLNPTGWDHYYGIVTADFNMDSLPDFVAGEDGHGYMTGMGHGSWNVHCVFDSWTFGGNQLRDIAAMDLNNDGAPDFVSASKGAGISVYITHVSGSGTSFSQVNSPASDGDYIGIAIADVTQDGLPDILASSEGSGASGVDLWVRERDFSLLTINNTYPENEGTFNIGTDTSIYLNFNKPVDSSTLTYENVQLKQDQILVPYSLYAYNNNATVRIDPAQLEREKIYTVTIRGGSEGLRDLYGNQFDGNFDGVAEESPTDDYVFSFTVIDTTPPSIPGGLHAEPIDHGVILTWAANSDPFLDADLEGYWVITKHPAKHGEGTYDVNVYYLKEQLGTPPTITLRGYDNGVPLQFSIVSQDYTGNYSDYSEWIEATPVSERPEIWWAGMYNSDISVENGGNMTILAYVVDAQGDLANVEIYFDGVGTGVYLYDDGQHGDFGAGDGLYALTGQLGPLDPSIRGNYPFELVATDQAGNRSFTWPYLTALEDLPGQSDESYRYSEYEAAYRRFLKETEIPFDGIGIGAASPDRPQIWCGGYQSYSAVDWESGPLHALTAIVFDPNGYDDIDYVEFYVAGIATGYYLVDDGTAEDFGPNDMLFGIDLTMPGAYNDNEDLGHLPPGPITLEIRACDKEGHMSDLWPYFVIN